MKNWKLSWSYVPIVFGFPAGTFDNITQKSTHLNNLNGDALKLKFTNVGNAEPLVIDRIAVAKKDRLSGVESGEVCVTRSGATKIELAPGEECWSDEVDFAVTPSDDIVVYAYFASRTPVKTVCSTWSAGTWQSVYLDGDTRDSGCVSKAEGLPFAAGGPMACTALTGFCEIALSTDADVRTIALFGDSITHMSYFSDPLTKLLFDSLPGKVTVTNSGIGGNRVLFDSPAFPNAPAGRRSTMFGKPGIDRFEKDVFGDVAPDVVFVMEGVNDCTHSFQFGCDPVPTAAEIMGGLDKFVDVTHAHGGRAIVSTVMPMGYYTEPWREPAEQIRMELNELIRAGGKADEVVDLDAMMRKPDDVHNLRDDIHGGDGLHPGVEGGKTIAKALLPILTAAIK